MADEQKSSEQESGSPANPFGMPDFSQMLSQMQMPGVDFDALMKQGQKNIEAVQEANRAVAEGWQALSQKQMEIFQQTMEQWQENMSSVAGSSPTENMERQAQAAREGFEQALANMRELAQIAADSQSKAMDIMRQRFEENMRSMMPGSSGQEKNSDDS